MRSLRKSWIGIVLVFFFGISLFFWKQSTVVSNIFNSDTVIAKVGDTKISTTRFNRGLQLNIKQFNDILGKELTSEEIKNYQIHQLALSAIINETIFENDNKEDTEKNNDEEPEFDSEEENEDTNDVSDLSILEK